MPYLRRVPLVLTDTFANRPAAGVPGRLFVSSDTHKLYRDNGSTWDEIGDGIGSNLERIALIRRSRP